MTAPVKLTDAQADGLVAVAAGRAGAKVSNRTALPTDRREPTVFWKVAETLERLTMIELHNHRTWATVTDAGRAVAERLMVVPEP